MSKTLDKLSKILHMAENASTEEEAALYNEKAQFLATQCGIELEVARQHQRDTTKRQTPVQERVPIGERGKKGLSNFVDLYTAIARNNDVKVNIAHNSTAVFAFGFPSDIEVVNALYGSLLGQMTQGAEDGVKAGKHKEEPFYSPTTGVLRTDARVWKGGFYSGFVSSISRRLSVARLDAENAKMTVETEDGNIDIDGDNPVMTAELVLAPKRKEVHDFYRATSNARGTYKGGSSMGSSYGIGSGHGRAAGNSARLGASKAISNPRAVR